MSHFQKTLCRLGLAAFALLFCWSILRAAEPPDAAATAAVESAASVEQAAATIEGQKTALSFGLDRIPELRRNILQIPIWQYLATGIYVILALLAARVFNYLATVQLSKRASKTKTELDDMLIDLLHSPVKILAFVLLLDFGFNLFQWPDWLERWITTGFKVLLAFSLTYMAVKVVDVLASYWRRRLAQKADKSFNELLIPLVSKSLKTLVLIMGILVTLDNLNFNIRTLLAGVSISGLALGLAAQDTIGNLFGAAAVFIDKPFKIGDRVQLAGIDGIVEEMGLRSTRIRNLDGHLITVPNKTMGNSTITNISLRPTIKTVLNIGVTYDTTTEKIRQALGILEEVYRKNPQTHDLIIGFNQFADSSLNLNIIHWWKEVDFKKYMAGMQEMNLDIKRRFDEAGISFAFPSRTVYLRQDNDWRIQPIEKA
jgi:MscS family membrane protein